MSIRRIHLHLERMHVTLLLVMGFALLLGACRNAAGPTMALGVVSQSQDVGVTVNLPKKELAKGRFGLLATGLTANTLQVTELNVHLSGPGFLQTVVPREGERVDADGNGTLESARVDVTSENVVTQIRDVYAGPNRYIKVVAKNGAQKLHLLGGVSDVALGQTNQMVIGLNTTPTALVIEKLAKTDPEAMQGDPGDPATAFSNKRLQAWMDRVMRPTADNKYPMGYEDGARTYYRTRSDGAPGPSIHPYLVDAQAIASQLRAGALNPVSLDAFLTPSGLDLSNPTAQGFVLHPGRLEVLTPVLPVGSRLWINDPLSPIYEVDATNAGTTTWVFDQVAPAFEGGLAGPWTFTLVTPPHILTRQFTVPRQPLSAARPPKEVIDLTTGNPTADPNYEITSVVLSPGEYGDAASTMHIEGREVRQMYAYGVASSAVALMTPDLFEWDVQDPATTTVSLERLKVGNTSALNDYGLIYPLGETDPLVASDVIVVEAALRANTAKKASVGVTVSHLGATDGDASLSVNSDLTYLTTDLAASYPKPVDDTTATRPRINNVLALTDQFVKGSFKLIEPSVPPGTTYRWVSESPLVKFEDPTAGPIAKIYALGEFTGQVRVWCYSSTGRYASGGVTAAFSTGTINATVQGDGTQAQFFPLTNYAELPENDPATNPGFAPVIPADATYPLGGHLADRHAVMYMSASDPTEPDEGKFFWRTSDPLTVEIAPATHPLDPVATDFPTRRVKLKAIREGTVTITAMDRKGREISTPITFAFRRGLVGGTITLPINPFAISLTGPAPTGGRTTVRSEIESMLNQGPYATCVVYATEDNQATPKFNWISNDPLMLKIEPVPGDTFPANRALFTSLRSGSASYTLVSANTEKMTAGLPLSGSPTNYSYNASHPYAVYVAYAGAPASSSTFSGKTLLVKKDGDAAYGISGSAVALNKVVRLLVYDADDAGANVIWSVDDPRQAQLLNATGPAIDVRLLKTGTHTFRVVNHVTQKWGVYTLTVTNGTADATVRITL